MQSQSLSTVDSLKPSLLNKETELSFEHGITGIELVDVQNVCCIIY